MIASKLIAGAFARDRAADTALTGLGVSAALVSATFAGYMIASGPQGDSRERRASVSGGSVAMSEIGADAVSRTVSTLGDVVDFTPTGTIPAGREAPALAQPGAAAGTRFPDFVVRDVFDDNALIEANGSLHMVSRGDMLEGAGEVLAIERNSRGWVVRTAGGTIRQRR